MNSPYEVLLYYKYSRISDPEDYAANHRILCERLNLKGRILIAREGVNGTVSGSIRDTAEYRRAMDEDPITAGISWKIDHSDTHVFPKLSLKVRDEVVSLNLGSDDFSPEDLTATHLKPDEWRELMNGDDVVIIDARNDYEWEIGRFEGALLPDVPSFRDLPGWVREHRNELEGKKILTYCTGGIRCEKFSGFLLKEGLLDVYQLDGGIVTYGKDESLKGEGFEGECYVFDERLSVPVNRTGGSSIISHCAICNEPSIRYRNCSWKPCNAQFFCCARCETEVGRFCLPVCQEAAIMSPVAVEGQ
ncbi:rhodanese-related sulfurtransferase [Akkermansiaceae bacterium]|nr:rhodanese-related sulfurtransferase [Akkermansiaceae bacterium]